MAQAGPVLLIGSIPLQDSSHVFRTLAEHLGDLASRYPDGETGERINWVRWQRHVFDDNPDLELIGAKKLAGFNDTLDRPFYRLRTGVDVTRFRFKPLGYGERAIQSFDEFRRLKLAGVIPRAVKFQVCLPTAVSLLSVFVHLEDRAALEPALEAALKAEVETIVAHIPHTELAMQWDVCHEIVGHDGGIELHFSNILANASQRVSRLVEFVPAGVEVGLHLCYGDPGHKHVVEPVDTRTCVNFVNRITEGTRRPIHYVHIPIPRAWKTDEYYTPLADLALPGGTNVYLGLVHYTDAIAGTKQRIAVAKRSLPHFGIATECGFGRRDPGTVNGLLELHRLAAAELA